MMETVSISETLVNLYQTTHRHHPEDSPLHDLEFRLVITETERINNSKKKFLGEEEN
jgi:hypothetical protein